jgi:hypothetical protein
MEEKIKKMFAVFMLPIIFSNSFPFLKIHLKKKEENPDIVQVQRSVNVERNGPMSYMTATASTITAFIEDMFKK